MHTQREGGREEGGVGRGVEGTEGRRKGLGEEGGRGWGGYLRIGMMPGGLKFAL